jgi:hypothetical protein
MAQYEFNPAAINPEAIRDLMRQVGGTNLAGQSMAGPVATGQAYAQQIAGGMPMEQVIAPGVSYSPEMAGGYTQADLRKKEIYGDFDGVMPVAPTKGTPFAPNEGFVQMPSAPQGVSGPTRILPEQTPFMGIPDFIRNLDFSNLPRLEDIQDIRGVENIRPSLFDIDVEEILKDIDTEKFADIDFSGIDIPPVATGMPELPDFSNIPTPENVSTSFMPGSGMGRIGQGVATDRESLIGKTVFGQTITPESFGSGPMKEGSFLGGVARPDLPAPEFSFGGKPTPAPTMPQVQTMPQTPVIPEPVMQQPVRQEVPFVPEIPTIPMNFTGLPQMPAIQNIPVMPELPYFPQPIQPMNFTRLSNLPVSNFVQPSVDEIVSPISRSRTLPQTPRGLFSF